MTEKQKRFCDEYLIDCNATRAYKTVYQNVKSDEVARKAGSRLLTNVDVKNYIADRMEEIHNEKTADDSHTSVLCEYHKGNTTMEVEEG